MTQRGFAQETSSEMIEPRRNHAHHLKQRPVARIIEVVLPRGVADEP